MVGEVGVLSLMTKTHATITPSSPKATSTSSGTKTAIETTSMVSLILNNMLLVVIRVTIDLKAGFNVVIVHFA